MRRTLLLFAIFLILFFATAAAAVQETLAQSIVRHRDFFVKLNGYEGCLLSDAEPVGREKLGIILLSVEGFEQHLVFDVKAMVPVYANARVLNKTDREFLLETSIKMGEVKRLAKAAALRAEELKKIWPLHEGKPGNIPHPQNPASTDEVLERFRAEVKGLLGVWRVV